MNSANRNDTLRRLTEAAEQIGSVEALEALAWMAEQIAAGKIQRPAHLREDHDCVDIFDAWGLAASDTRRAMHSILAVLGLRKAHRGLPIGGPS